MGNKKTISGLMQNLQDNVTKLEGVDVSLEKSLALYEKSIGLSKDLLSLLDRQHHSYTTLKKNADELFDD